MQNTAIALDPKAQQCAQNYLSAEASLLTVLTEMKAQNAFLTLGFTGIYTYCVHRLKLSEAQSYYFKSVAEKSESVPELKTAIQEGKLSLSKARRIVPVVTPENLATWIEKSHQLTQKELEREVTWTQSSSTLNLEIEPLQKKLTLKIDVDVTTQQTLQRLKELLAQKRQRPVSLSDVIEWLAQEMVKREDPVKKAERVLKKQSTSKPNPTPIHSSSRKTRQPIPAAIQNIKWQESQGQCEAVGTLGFRCREKQWLEMHHRVPVSQGGMNSVQNLILLCRKHHRQQHQASLGSIALSIFQA
jgi:HNH endonuclease